jgi:hypothetical protein
MDRKITIQAVDQRMAICRLPMDKPIPEWVYGEGFWSVTRTDEECSVVCDEEQLPDEIEAERNWLALKVKGPLDFSLTGILSSLLDPLAGAGISVFALSTYNTDYLLIKADRYGEALSVLAPYCTIEENTPPE